MSTSPLRPDIEEIVDSLDAALFGDGFCEPAARAELRRMMARWERELQSLEQT